MALGGKKENKPTRLGSARERLDAAMSRLDKAVARNSSTDHGAEMDSLRAANEKLASQNKITGERLDGAIKRLKAVLEEV